MKAVYHGALPVQDGALEVRVNTQEFVEKFVGSRLRFSPNAKVHVVAMRDAWKRACLIEFGRLLPRMTMVEMLESKGVEKSKGGGIRHWLGVELSP